MDRCRHVSIFGRPDIFVHRIPSLDELSTLPNTRYDHNVSHDYRWTLCLFTFDFHCYYSIMQTHVVAGQGIARAKQHPSEEGNHYISIKLCCVRNLLETKNIKTSMLN